MRSLLLSAALLAVSAPAVAAQGEVCASAPQPMTGALTNDTAFVCPNAGSLTIPQLYAQGWRVVSVFPQVASLGEGPQGMASQWVVVIEKL